MLEKVRRLYNGNLRWINTNPEARVKDLDLVSDERQLFHIASLDPDSLVRKEAVKRISNLELLGEIIQREKVEWILWDAVMRFLNRCIEEKEAEERIEVVMDSMFEEVKSTN